jgi:hypothetical protein
MTKIDVRVAALDAHAAKLDAQGARTGEVAATALGAVALQPVAFGLLCSFLVPVVTTHQMASLAGITAVAAAMKGESLAIKAAAAGYDALDEQLAGKIAGI